MRAVRFSYEPADRVGWSGAGDIHCVTNVPKIIKIGIIVLNPFTPFPDDRSYNVGCWHGSGSIPSGERHLQACASIGRRSKPGQAKPSSAKQIQTKLLGFAWFYSSESGLINGLQRFQIEIFLLALRLIGPSPPSFSDDCDDVGRLQIFAR
jgi:hypothetical protein